MVERTLPLGWIAAGAVFIAAAPSFWQWMDSVPDVKQNAAIEYSQTSKPPAPPFQVISNLELFGSIGKSAPSVAAPVDSIARAPDLKRVFDQYINNAEPRQRRMAVSAFEACVPAFLPASGQSASPEALISALPPQHRTEREAAYRLLYSRCQRLVAEDRTALLSTARSLQADAQAESPGRKAGEAALAGRLDEVESLVAEALDQAEPAAVASLAGVATRVAALRHSDAPDAAELRRARAVDLALPLVGCDLGLDCSYQSLWALQLCAAEALCEGGVPERLMAGTSPSDVDPSAVQDERSRLLGLIRSGRRLHIDDLLPP